MKSSPKIGSITEALRASAAGVENSREDLLALVYDDLRRIARRKLEGLAPGQTLQTTALVHEAWMQVAEPQRKEWDNRAHFFGAAARAMRNILVDQARRRAALKRGGMHRRVDEPIEIPEARIDAPAQDMLALDESLKRLEQIEPRKAQVVMLRFFTGLSMRAVADVLQVSMATVERDWRFARSWLQDQIENPRAHDA